MRPLAHEDVVGPHVDDDVEVARRPTQLSALALAGEAQLVAILHAGRDRDLEQLLAALASGAVACLARMAIEAALASTRRTRAGHREESLREPDLPLPATRRARLRPRAGLLSVAAARLAGLEARDLELGVHALGGFLERDLEVVAKIVAALRARAPAAAAASEEPEA